jgi:hypothetical protein
MPEMLCERKNIHSFGFSVCPFVLEWGYAALLSIMGLAAFDGLHDLETRLREQLWIPGAENNFEIHVRFGR